MNTDKKKVNSENKEPVIRKKSGPKEKPESEKLSKIVMVRFTQLQHKQLMNEVTPLTLKNNIRMGDLIRLKLFSDKGGKLKRVVEKSAKGAGGTNQQLIDATTELHLLRNELVAIGRNINQTVKKIHGTEYAENVRSELQSLVVLGDSVTGLINNCETINTNLLAWYQS